MSALETPPRHRCTVVGCDTDDARFEVARGQRVLHEMIRRNVRAVPVGCRGGGCGVCRVRVLDGEYRTLRMSAKHISADDAARGIVLACRIIPVTDLVIELAPTGGNAPTPSTSPSRNPTSPPRNPTSPPDIPS